MSQADVDVVLDQFAAVNERDFPRAMDGYADDVVLVVHPSFGIESGTAEGRDSVGRWFGDWFQSFARDFRFEIQEARELGDLIFIYARLEASGRASGAQATGDASYLYRVADGKVTRVELFGDRDEALRAAGGA
jgi:ketosteroid isomerase-like protein